MAAKPKRRSEAPLQEQAPKASVTAQAAGAERKRKVFLVDDHPIVRERLAELIAQETDLEVCGEAEDANTALKLIGALQARHRDRGHLARERFGN